MESDRADPRSPSYGAVRAAFEEHRTWYRDAGKSYVAALLSGNTRVQLHNESWLKGCLMVDKKHADQAMYFFRQGASEALATYDWSAVGATCYAWIREKDDHT